MHNIFFDAALQSCIIYIHAYAYMHIRVSEKKEQIVD